MILSRKLHIAVLLIFCLVLAVSRAVENPNRDYRGAASSDLIETAYSSGEITRGDKIYYNLVAVINPEQLPDRFKSAETGVIRSGTPFVNEALDHWDMMSSSQQAAASALMARPETDSLYISPGGHFAIHYEIGTSDGVPPEDLDSSNVPDFVERIGIYADSSYRQYQINLGYYPPPQDVDSFYDIYLLHIGNYYGVTIREGAGDSAWNDYKSYIQLHNNFEFAPSNQDPEGTIIGAQKVTVAHEYFHATQLAYAYKNGPDLWFTEGTAVFFENDMFDQANDHYSYLPYFFNYPDTFLIDTNLYGSNLHNYSTFVWPEFLAKKYGRGILKTIWEYERYYTPLASMDSALKPFGADVETAFPEFTLWNYFTGVRYDTAYHDDGADYPLIVVDPIIPACPFEGVTSMIPPDGLASNYIMTYPDTSVNGLLALKFDGDNTVEWGFSWCAFKNGDKDIAISCDVDYLGRTNCGIYDFVLYDSILFIPCVVSQWHDDNQYEFTTVIHPFGDADGSGEVNILDATYLLNFLYKDGLSPKYDTRMGDIDASGAINILDVVYLIDYLYRGGPEPLAYRS